MTRACYHRAINAAQLSGFVHLADVLLMLYAFDYPKEVPAEVLSLRGTRPEGKEESPTSPTIKRVIPRDDNGERVQCNCCWSLAIQVIDDDPVCFDCGLQYLASRAKASTVHSS